MGFRLRQKLSGLMARHRQQCHPATSERQISVVPLSLSAAQSFHGVRRRTLRNMTSSAIEKISCQRHSIDRFKSRTRNHLKLLFEAAAYLDNATKHCRATRSACPALLPRRSVSWLAGLLDLDRPLTGNSVRRAGSNSPPGSGRRPELRCEPGRDSVHSFFARFERSSPGGRGTQKVHFSGRAGVFAA
jgi:hypothetical protein